MGGWAEVKSMRRLGERQLSDERILGSGVFVERMIGEANDRLQHQFTPAERLNQAKDRITKTCIAEGISRKVLISGSRRRRISNVRFQLAVELVEKIGLSMAETARRLGVSTSAVSKIIRKHESGK